MAAVLLVPSVNSASAKDMFVKNAPLGPAKLTFRFLVSLGPQLHGKYAPSLVA